MRRGCPGIVSMVILPRDLGPVDSQERRKPVHDRCQNSRHRSTVSVVLVTMVQDDYPVESPQKPQEK